MRYHYAFTRMAKIIKTDDTKCWQGYEATGALMYCCQECKMIQPLWKIVCFP